MSLRARTLLIAVLATAIGLAGAVWLIARAVLTEARIRSTAAAYVKAYTGRDLTIEGPISLSFVPWLGAELREVTLSDPSTVARAPIRLSEFGLKVRLLPLLQRRIEVGGIRARGGELSVAGYDLRGVALTTGGFGDARQTDLTVAGTLAPAGARGVPFSLTSRMTLDITREALELAGVKGALGGLSFTGDVHGTRVMEAPALDASIATGTFDLRRLLADLGTPYAAADPKALRSASLSARIASSPSSLQLSDVIVTLDGTRISGRATRTGTVRPEWDASLQADTLDVDRYLPGPGPGASEEAGAGEYPALRNLIARARLDVQRLIVRGLLLTKVSATLTARNGVISFGRVRAACYDGASELAAKMDVRGAVPAYHVEGRLAHVSVQPLLTAAQSISALAGTGDVSFSLDATGYEAGRLTRAMNGQIAMSVEDGHLEGADLVDLLTRAQALSDRLRGKPASVSSNPTARTKFSRLSGTATINRGVAHNTDLAIDAPSLKAAGEGTIDLNTQTIDYLLRASSREVGNVMVPIAIAGPFASPSYTLQAGALIREAGRQELKKQLEKRGLGRLFKIPK